MRCHHPWWESMARKEKDSEDTGKRHTCCGMSWYNFKLHAKFNHWQLPIHIEFPLSSIASSDTLSVRLSSTPCLQPFANRFSGTGLSTRYLSQVIWVYYCSTNFFAESPPLRFWSVYVSRGNFQSRFIDQYMHSSWPLYVSKILSAMQNSYYFSVIWLALYILLAKCTCSTSLCVWFSFSSHFYSILQQLIFSVSFLIFLVEYRGTH